MNGRLTANLSGINHILHFGFMSFQPAEPATIHNKFTFSIWYKCWFRLCLTRHFGTLFQDSLTVEQISPGDYNLF